MCSSQFQVSTPADQKKVQPTGPQTDDKERESISAALTTSLFDDEEFSDLFDEFDQTTV